MKECYSVAVQVMPDLIRGFHERYPAVTFELYTATADHIKEGSLSYADSGYKQESLKMGNTIQQKKAHRKEGSLVRC